MSRAGRKRKGEYNAEVLYGFGMQTIGIIFFWINVFLVFWALIGYPLSLRVLQKLGKAEEMETGDYEPDVTVMIVAHNEEKVIEEKLKNVIACEYPQNKLQILVTSDCSTDATNAIVKEFCKSHPEYAVTLYETVEHKGKTNAQNEAQKLVQSEILVLTDANAMFEKDAIRKLVQPFCREAVSYVTGQLKYVNSLENKTAQSENMYWRIDIACREIESKLQTITAGNGAIYACRNREYKVVNPIKCHDSSMPLLYALEGKRAVYAKDAVAYEKAGEADEDEWKRKVRMNRNILSAILPDIRILNVFRYKWFTYFYLGHRTCRYLLWLGHLLALVTNVLIRKVSWFYMFTLILQVVFYGIALVTHITGCKNRIARIIYYYCMMVWAQWVGVYHIISGKAKPVWEKAESTR